MKLLPEDIKVLQKMSSIQYAKGRGDWGGVDCWGVIELAYKECPSIGIILPNRGKHEANSIGLYKAWKKCNNFKQVEDIQNFDVYMMSSIINDRSIVGHCGLIYNGGVMHCEEGVGILYESLKAPQITCRKQFMIRHASLT